MGVVALYGVQKGGTTPEDLPTTVLNGRASRLWVYAPAIATHAFDALATNSMRGGKRFGPLAPVNAD